MTKYRKKPVEIDAMQFKSTAEGDQRRLWDYQDIFWRWLNGKSKGGECRSEGGCLIIPTLEGDMKASDGDYIIEGVSGELYPCKPDIFKETYELVE